MEKRCKKFKKESLTTKRRYLWEEVQTLSSQKKNLEDRGRKRFHLGAWTYDGYEEKSIPLPVAANTKI